MKKSLFLLMFFSIITTSKAQTILFEDSFESYTDFAISNVGNWTLRDLDQATDNYILDTYFFPNHGNIPSFIVFNPSQVSLTPDATEPFLNSSTEPKTGDKYMAAFASYNIGSNNEAITVIQNDWLISPQITLGSSENMVRFWAKTYEPDYGSERFKVLISSTDTEVQSFTPISLGDYIEATGSEWTEFSYTIPVSYNSADVFIAIQCVSDDSYVFMVDDFKVTTTGTVNVDKFFKENFTIFPNPTTEILNISSINNLEFQEVSIIDLTGKKIISVHNTSGIDVSELASGTYIIEIQSLEGKATTKFIKK